MDFSGLILIPLAAIIAACWIIGRAIMSKIGRWFRTPFLLSYGLGVIFMEPWRIASWQELGMFVVMLVNSAFSVTAGCIIGGFPAMFVVAVGTKLKRRFGL